MATGAWGGTGDTRVFRVNIQFRHGSQNCQTGFHIRDVGVNTLTPEDVATEAAEFATTQFVKLLHTTDQLIGVDAENLATHEGFAVSPASVTGTEAGTPCPSFITVPISLKGNLRKRYGNGRMLWPIYNQESINGNQLVAAAQTVVQTVIADFTSRYMEGALFGTQRLVHLHGAFTPKGPNTPLPATWYDITSVRANTVVSALRRRKAGVGS